MTCVIPPAGETTGRGVLVGYAGREKYFGKYGEAQVTYLRDSFLSSLSLTYERRFNHVAVMPHPAQTSSAVTKAP